MFQRRVAIISGLGMTGRPVFERLRARCVDAVPASRSTSPAFDWTDRSTWRAALRGATAAYVTYPPGLGRPRAPDDIAAFARIAADMGVEHVALLSVLGKRRTLRAEARLRAAPLDHTILRVGPLSDGDPDMIADLAVAALCDPAHLNRTYEMIRGRPEFAASPSEWRTGCAGRIALAHVESEPSYSS